MKYTTHAGGITCPSSPGNSLLNLLTPNLKTDRRMTGVHSKQCNELVLLIVACMTPVVPSLSQAELPSVCEHHCAAMTYCLQQVCRPLSAVCVSVCAQNLCVCEHPSVGGLRERE